MSQLQKVNTLLSTNKAREARDTCIKLCKKHKNDLHARFLLGLAHGQLNEYKKAEACFKFILEKSPHDIKAHYNLGLVCQKTGNYKQAEITYENALKLDPNLFEAKYNLAEVLREKGELEKAEDIFRDLLSTGKYRHMVNLGIASVLYARNRHEEAIAYIDRSIIADPCQAMSYRLKGKILCAIGHTDTALAAYEKAIAIQPSLVDAHIEIGDIHFKNRDLIKAETHYKSAIHYGCKNTIILLKIGDVHILKAEASISLKYYLEAARHDPNNPHCYAGLGQAYEAIGNIEKALQCYEHSLALDNHLESAISGKARMLIARGRYDDAYHLVHKNVESGTNSQDIISVYAEIAIHQDDQKSAIQALAKFLENYPEEAPPPKKAHYQLGSLYDKTGEYDKAFVHFRMANQYSDEVVDIGKQLSFIDNMIMAFPNDAKHNMPSSGNQSQLPVFIVGMPRSGTTLVEQILDSHPMIYGAGELQYIMEIFTKLTNNDSPESRLFPASMMHLDNTTLSKQAELYIEKLRNLSGKAVRAIDKLPHNFLFIGLIELLFPNARIIHCRRNNIDTCLSIYFHDMNASHAYATNLKNLGHFYCKYTKIMNHWKKTSNLPILDVQYEEIVNNQVRISRELVEFCGLEWDSKCLDYHKNKRAVITHSTSQVRKPMYTNSLERWRNYEKHIITLIDALDSNS